MINLFALAPKEAIAFFRSKGLEPSFAWQDVWEEEHARDFTVAKILQRDLLQDYRNEFDKALTGGLPFEHFQKAMLGHLDEHGMNGPVKVEDPLTGKSVTVNLATKRRLRTVFYTNMRTAYARGRWERAWRSRALLPYLRYHHNDVRFPRPEHVAWDGTVLPIEDPWWDTHYPPCAWGCKCSTESLSARMLASRGLGVTETPVKFQPVVYTNPRTGEISQIEKGISPGWNYNIGKAPLRPLTARPAPPPPGVANLYHVDADREIDGFLSELGASDKPRTVTDSDDWPLVFSRDLFKDQGGEPRVPRPDLPGTLPLVGRALAKAGRKGQWLWSDELPTVPPALEQRLNDLAGVGLAKGDVAHEAVGLARVAGHVAQAFRKEGVEIDGYSIMTDSQHIRHIFKARGDSGRAADHNLLQVTADALKRLVEGLTAPSRIATGLVDRSGKPAVAIIKDTAEGIAVAIFRVATRRRQLEMITFKELPAGALVERVKRTLDLNVRNAGGAAIKIIELLDENKVQRQSLIRRYIVPVDNAVVVIDFVDGAWTYDVQPATTPATP